DNRDKSWLVNTRFTLTHYGGNGYGLYSDVLPHSAIFEKNTVVGCDINHHNFPGGGDIKNIISRQNTFYGGTLKEIDFVSAPPPSNNKIDSCQIEENLFFHLGHGDGAIRVNDASNNNVKDTVWVINKNRYFSPNYSPHIYQTVNGSQHIYGSLTTLQSMGYESSPNSYFGDWAKFRYWSNNNVVTFTGADITASNFTSTPWPAYGTGGAQVATVSTGPLGVSVRITCTNVTSSSGAAIFTHSTLPIYTQTLSPHEVYKITLMISSAKKKDLYGFMRFNMKHPKTGDQLSGTDYFVFPIKSSYQPDTFQIYYKPRHYQYNNSFRIFLEKNDTLWIKNLKIERIDTSSIKDIRYYYPIFINPSDNPATFSLQPCHVYLDTDSNLVVGSVTVAPWSSKVLIFQKCDPLLSVDESDVPVSYNQHILVYPNPARQQITIRSTAVHDFEILDINGRVLSKGHRQAAESIQSLEGLLPGVYIYRAIFKNQNSNRTSNIHLKIIKTE
ncbi:MAG: T9SS C-terminal target domain-containing protein, partial [Bacteroidetes bacterium]